MNVPVMRESNAAATTAHRTVRSRKHSPAQLRSWEEVNARLGYVGEMERQLRSLRNQFEQKVAVLKQQWVEGSQPVTREKKKVEEQIECFFWSHQDEVFATGRKSVELVFGRLGTRRSRSLSVDDAAAAQQWLTRHGLQRFLRVRTELDREALRSAMLGCDEGSSESAAELAGCPGIRLRDDEEFWYEADVTRHTTPAAAEAPARKPAATEKPRAAALAAL